MISAAIEYVNVLKTEYIILKNIYKLSERQRDFERLYEVEENLKSGNYNSMKANYFINST